MTYDDLDTSARYRVNGWPAIAVYVAGPVETMTEVQYSEPCGDEDCECGGLPEHYLYDVEPSTDPSRALVVMVGDDRPEAVDVEDLIPVDTDDVCSCGALGCHSPAALA